MKKKLTGLRTILPRLSVNNEQLLVCHSFYYLRIRNKKTDQPAHHCSKVLCHYLYLRVMKKKLTGLRTTFLRLSISISAQKE
jgi:hypothetical protein